MASQQADYPKNYVLQASLANPFFISPKRRIVITGVDFIRGGMIERSGVDRRKWIRDPDYFKRGGVERRVGLERRFITRLFWDSRTRQWSSALKYAR